ncbi:MAG TPA: alpha,alpha-trehalase TreF [Kofleriaceae bacterium]|nr:alpha,alpha-trehalase TreF [Kofleriaceae bacterium]
MFRPALIGLICFAAVACRASSTPSTPSTPSYRGYDPPHDLGALFHDVQLAQVFPDSKTFVDARARSAPADIAGRYAAAKQAGPVDLAAFVRDNFEPPPPLADRVQREPGQSMEDHIRALWPVLTRAADRADPGSTLIPLPEPYVVPGGRFREVYYWDSYFTMQGLVASGRLDLVKNMLDNFAYLITTTGHIPNGNRTYYLGRSQPPYFGAMVALYAQAAGVDRAEAYLDALEREHAFWMEGASALRPGEAHRRVVRMRNGAVLNRYWDDLAEPRPESYREDFALVQDLAPAARAPIYRNLRATAESGWDFSSRWMRDPKDLKTLETTDLAPIDLQALLYELERTIAMLRTARHQAGDADVAAAFTRRAEDRKRAIVDAAFDPAAGYFFDVRWKTGARVVDRPTLAAAAVLYFGLASPEQGKAVAAVLERDFLQPGGFVTTKIASGQQWDAPNGWPPLQWLAIRGVAQYTRGDLAKEATARWLTLNRRVFAATGKLTEKYDVVDLSKPAGGGEYPTQDGFGWTNGVALALAADH